MLDLITKGLTKVFGTKADKDVKILTPYISKINNEFTKLATITDDELRGKTEYLKGIIADRLKTVDDELASLHKQVEEDETIDILDKEQLFERIDELESKRDEELEKVLMDILPEAFAVVKETARRLTEIKQLVVTATMLDRELAATKPHIKIEG
ncbi:MAG: preprotein translocase subunit SecA, partial [Marinoscillum sp.]